MRGKNSQTFHMWVSAGDSKVSLDGDAPDASRTRWRATATARRSWALQKTGGWRNTLQGCSRTSSAEKGSRLAKAACRREPYARCPKSDSLWRPLLQAAGGRGGPLGLVWNHWTILAIFGNLDHFWTIFGNFGNRVWEKIFSSKPLCDHFETIGAILVVGGWERHKCNRQAARRTSAVEGGQPAVQEAHELMARHGRPCALRTLSQEIELQAFQHQTPTATATPSCAPAVQGRDARFRRKRYAYSCAYGTQERITSFGEAPFS